MASIFDKMEKEVDPLHEYNKFEDIVWNEIVDGYQTANSETPKETNGTYCEIIAANPLKIILPTLITIPCPAFIISLFVLFFIANKTIKAPNHPNK